MLPGWRVFFQLLLQKGPDITTFGFVTDIYIQGQGEIFFQSISSQLCLIFNCLLLQNNKRFTNFGPQADYCLTIKKVHVTSSSPLDDVIKISVFDTLILTK